MLRIMCVDVNIMFIIQASVINLLQDEKNEIITMNMWLIQVSSRSFNTNTTPVIYLFMDNQALREFK